MTFTQLDNDGSKFVTWLMLIGPTIRRRQNIVHMKGNVSQLFKLFHRSNVIFTIVCSH
jgi:hypothetical protein